MATSKVLIVGGGFAGLDIAIRLRKHRPNVAVTLVSPSENLIYRPWLIYLPSAERELSELNVSLAAGARRHGFALRVDSVVKLDPDGQAQLSSGATERFTHCVVTTGAVTDTSSFPGADEFAFTPCELLEASRLTEAAKELSSGAINVIIAGERPGPGLEYAGWLGRALRKHGTGGQVTMRVVDQDDLLAGALGGRAMSRVIEYFTTQGHELISNVDVKEISANTVGLADGRQLPSDITAVVGTLRAHDIGLPPEAVDDRGFVRVDRTFSSTEYGRLFAAGDAACMPDGCYLPKSMMMARRQVPMVASNVLRVVDGEQPREFNFDAARRSVAAMPDIGGRTVFVKNGKLVMSGKLPLLIRSVIDWSYLRSHRF